MHKYWTALLDLGYIMGSISAIYILGYILGLDLGGYWTTSIGLRYESWTVFIGMVVDMRSE